MRSTMSAATSAVVVYFFSTARSCRRRRGQPAVDGSGVPGGARAVPTVKSRDQKAVLCSSGTQRQARSRTPLQAQLSEPVFGRLHRRVTCYRQWYTRATCFETPSHCRAAATHQQLLLQGSRRLGAVAHIRVHEEPYMERATGLRAYGRLKTYATGRRRVLKR